MNNYNVSDEPVTEVAVDINDIKDTCNEKGRNEECVFLVAGRMIYRKGLDFLFDALMTIPRETRYQVRVVGDGPELVHLRKRCKDNLNFRRTVGINAIAKHNYTCAKLSVQAVGIMQLIKKKICRIVKKQV